MLDFICVDSKPVSQNAFEAKTTEGELNQQKKLPLMTPFRYNGRLIHPDLPEIKHSLQWLANNYELTDDLSQVSLAELRGAYVAFCREDGEVPIGRDNFGRIIKHVEVLDVVKPRTSGRQVVGIRPKAMKDSPDKAGSSADESDAVLRQEGYQSDSLVQRRNMQIEKCLMLSTQEIKSWKKELHQEQRRRADQVSSSENDSTAPPSSASLKRQVNRAHLGAKRRRTASDKFFDEAAIVPFGQAEQYVLALAANLGVPAAIAMEHVATLLASLEAGKHTKFVTFLPGKAGISVDRDGRVKQIDENGQAKVNGIQVGFRVLALNGEGFTIEKLSRCSDSTLNKNSYSIIFEKGYSGLDKHSFQSLISAVYQLAERCKDM